MIKTFKKENQTYADYLADNVDAKLYRYPEKIVVFTGDDLPPDDLDDKYCSLGIDGLREELKSQGHDNVRITAWLGKYL